MKIIRNAAIRKKIMSITAIAIVGFVSYLIIIYQVTEQNSSRLTEARHMHYPVLKLADSNKVSIDRLKELWISIVTTGDEDLFENASEIAKRININYKKIGEIGPTRIEIVQKLTNQFNSYFKNAKLLAEEIIKDELTQDKIKTLSSQVKKKLKVYETELIKFALSEQAHFDSALKDADKASHDMLIWGLIITGIVLFILISITLYISNLICSGINKVNLAMYQLSDGNLTTYIDYISQDEIGQLVEHHNDSLLKLRILVDGIIQGIIQLISTSDSLLDAMRHTSDSANQQKATTKQLTRSISTMTDSILNVARNTNKAMQSVVEADAKTQEGLLVVNNTETSIQQLTKDVKTSLDTIHLLQEDSSNIGQVLDVIKSIAEQTNLLALNAAIEAARAGEQGRGFAVVADEVRVLASRTQDSTLEIQRTIEKLQLGAKNSAEIMDRGNTQAIESLDLSNSSAHLLASIAETMKTVTDMNKHIAALSEEQSSMTKKINDNISNIHTLAEKTSTYADESTNTAYKMESLSEELTELVAQFKTK